MLVRGDHVLKLSHHGHSLAGVEVLRKPFSLDAILEVVRRHAV